ncbi:hypothetical protein [Brevibacillus borstelensis]|uniref:hypothetical protein n=1 Tax=Brevibacillus borstelensis TaxID=45462 RepID=UPI001171AC39|nr:hypothetical protein [Brevibacillus borstelensis]MED1881096.1 hypothetical protein [Brevibacillus borstelensis]MED2006730.1 hypothetical protein [Brevibacillus borstelensis]GED53507.1 hypothetical protein BBO01nite_27480 [Brevibacillus borstelensis]
MSNFSKRAIWMAVNSEHGDRLVQISREHASLAKRLIEEGKQLSEAVVSEMKARIDQLRTERDHILAQFERRC